MPIFLTTPAYDVNAALAGMKAESDAAATLDLITVASKAIRVLVAVAILPDIDKNTDPTFNEAKTTASD